MLLSANIRIRVVLRTNSEFFPEFRSGLRSESEYDFVLRANFRRNSSDISNGRHREFLWGTVNRRIGIRFRHVLRAGRRDVDGRLLTNVSRVFADVNGLPVSSPQLAADNRPVRPASPRRFRRGFREDLRSRSAPATCCTEYTANRLFRENKLRKRGKPSDSQIGREIPRKIARTRRRRRSTTSHGRYVGSSGLFCESEHPCGVFATLFCLKFGGKACLEAETWYHSTRMVRVLYPRTPHGGLETRALRRFRNEMRGRRPRLFDRPAARCSRCAFADPTIDLSPPSLRPDRSEAPNRSQTPRNITGRSRRLRPHDAAMKHRFFPPTRSKIGRAYDLGDRPRGKNNHS